MGRALILQTIAAFIIFGYLWTLVRSDLVYFIVTMLGGAVTTYLGVVATKKWWGGLPFTLLLPLYFSFSAGGEGLVFVFMQQEWLVFWLKDVVLPIYVGVGVITLFAYFKRQIAAR